MFTEHDREQIFKEETLERVTYQSSEYQHLRSPSPPPPPRGRGSQYYITDPGSAVLVQNLGPNCPDLVQAHQACEDDYSESTSLLSPCTADSMEVPPADGPAQADGVSAESIAPAEQATATNDQDNANAVLAAKAALEISANSASEQHEQPQKDRPPPTERVDSAHDDENEQPLPESSSSGNSSSTARPTPPRLRTSASLANDGSAVAGANDTIAASPNLSKHIRPVTEGNKNTLPVVQPNSPVQGRDENGSPQKLPSFKQLTQLADAAIAQEPNLPPPPHPPQLGRPHSQSFGSATAQSPRAPYHAYGPSSHTSPTYSTRSPTSTIGEMTHPYGSPTQFPGSAYYASRRRSSVATEGPPPYPTLQSASSSGESHGHGSSTDGGYSTAHTTPIDSAQVPPSPAAMMDASGRGIPILPPPPGMPQHLIHHGVFRCDQPGCQAPPFQTQYLLTSHRNVHSSVRAHYCPVEGCSRGEGGRGFKRKNEMIRHGLVHNSPGYICPFCPDRDHKYPRPDNLQRHVRVHHVDKDREDPALREVLAQRAEGPGKQRRRRTNQHGSIGSA